MGRVSRRTFTVAAAVALTGPLATGDSVAKPGTGITPDRPAGGAPPRSCAACG